MSDYMRVFLSAIGEAVVRRSLLCWQEVETYDSLDGRELVPYHCVVRTRDWEQAKPRFLEVFPLAKTAYRRANGGSSAPGVHENVELKYLTEELEMKEEEEALSGLPRAKQVAHDVELA